MRMEGHARTWFTPKQKAELWERWKSGQCVADIARALERRNKSGVYRVLAGNGGIAPAPRGHRNPDNDSNLAFLEELIVAVPALGLQLISVPMRTSDDFQAVIAAMMRRQPNAFVTTGDLLIQRHILEIIDFMAKHRLPAIYQEMENVRSGGLMAYGTPLPDLFRRGAWYVHRILQGAKPAELPVEQPTRFEFAINLKTAKALGLKVPDGLLAIATEVIE